MMIMSGGLVVPAVFFPHNNSNTNKDHRPSLRVFYELISEVHFRSHLEVRRNTISKFIKIRFDYKNR